MAIITSRTLPLRDWDQRSEREGPFGPKWHRAAPKSVTRAESWETGSQGWAAWAAYLANRRAPHSLLQVISGKHPALTWGMAWPVPAAATGRLPATLELVELLDRTKRGKAWNVTTSPADLAATWASETAHRECATFGLECLAWCHALPSMCRMVPANIWWGVLGTLVAAVDEAEPAAEHGVLSRQWLATELPLSLAYLFPEIGQTRRLARQTAMRLVASPEADILADGMPSARVLTSVRPLLATWARSRLIAQQMKRSPWDESTERRYRAFVTQSLRLTRRNGSMALGGGQCSEGADRELLAAAFDGLPPTVRAALRTAVPASRGPAPGTTKLPKPAANNEDAGLTVMRPSWQKRGACLTFARRGREVLTELSTGRETLWSGSWNCEVRRNGVQLVPAADAAWEEVCWSSTKDGDYLELELGLDSGTRVQRQIFLARKDGFLFLADAVLGEEPASLEYQSVLPLCDGIAFDPSTESREGYLGGNKARALLYPLALPEWRAEPAPGELEAVPGGLGLRAARQNVCRLYAPLWIDLDQQRLFQPATWRQLTLAEWRQIVPRDVAVGYRVQVRDKQWMVYRSLDKRGNRTLLGQNLVSEFLIARFQTSGETEPLLEIE